MSSRGLYDGMQWQGKKSNNRIRYRPKAIGKIGLDKDEREKS